MKDYSFGNYICALRTGLGLSQFQLGTLVGVSDKAVSKWENGDAKPRISTCYRLAEVLGVSINELLSCEKNNKAPTRKELDKMNNRLWDEAFERLSIFGKKPPAICYSRLAAEKHALYETDAIQSFAVLGKIEKTTQLDHAAYAVSMVSSSFTAWLLGATKVNPLPPHYRCPKCGNTEFISDINDGFDLPPKKCSCGTELIRDGHNIPFEGYVRNEQHSTSVDLRVSPESKPIVISAIQEFYNGKADILPVKLVFPDDRPSAIEIYVVLDGKRPKPQLHKDGSWHASSEDFWEWRGEETTYTIICMNQLQKIHLLQEMTGCNSPDPVLLATPQMAEKLYQNERRNSAYLTSMTDKFGKDEPHDFNMLMQISAFCHGAGVWAEYRYDGELRFRNGEAIFDNGQASFREIPAFREDIWNDISLALTRNNIRDNGLALQIMEGARQGQYYDKGMPAEYEELLLSLGLPEWYPEYLKKVTYLFQKGYCVSLLLFDMVLEWYNQQYPAEYAEICKLDEAFNATAD